MIQSVYLSLVKTGYLLFGISCVALIAFSITSWFENEKRAAGRSLLVLGTMIFLFFFTLFIPAPLYRFFYSSFAIIVYLLIVLFSLPYNFKKKSSNRISKNQIDEREIMFSRRLLEPGTGRYKSYYKEHPSHKEPDDIFRKNPGLLGIDSSFFQPLEFAAANASFETITGLHHLVDKPELQKEKSDLSPERHSAFIKKWAQKLGAHSVGITELQFYHKYSHVGRGPEFGQPVKLDHKYAIALTVEMDKNALDAAPYAPTVMESAQQYVNSGVIATQVAEFIRGLGFPARAHIDGNYRVVCPLVARDAGLGEIGRMGLLMTPKLGPRVRIAVVTTDLPLITSSAGEDLSVGEFCLRCKKCADVCPSKAISFEKPQEIDGVVRWQINQEKCFTYWTVVGTDCGRCVSVCPYSHPDTLLHNLVRKGLSRSSSFQNVALKMDDFFYGRKPQPKKLSEDFET